MTIQDQENLVAEWRANYEDAADLLNEYYDFYSGQLHPVLQKYIEIQMLALIFFLDISFEMSNITTLNPSGFAEKVAYRGLLLRLVEHQSHFDVRTINVDFREYVAEMNADLGAEAIHYPQHEINELRRVLARQFNGWSAWQTIRNDGAGHYTRISKQLPAIENIEPQKIVEVSTALMNYASGILDLMQGAHPEGFRLRPYNPLTARSK